LRKFIKKIRLKRISLHAILGIVGIIFLAVTFYRIVDNPLIYKSIHDKYLTTKNKIVHYNDPTRVVVINVSGMTCKSCETKVQKMLEIVDGVKSATVDHKQGVANVTISSKIDVQSIVDAIGKAGYSATLRPKSVAEK